MKSISFQKQDRQVIKTRRTKLVNNVELEWFDVMIIPSEYAVITDGDNKSVYFGFQIHDLPPYPAMEQLPKKLASEAGYVYDEPKGEWNRAENAKLEEELGSHSKMLEELHRRTEAEGRKKHEDTNQPGEYKYEFPKFYPDNRSKYALSKDNCIDYFNRDGLTYVRFNPKAFGGLYSRSEKSIIKNISKLNKTNLNNYREEYYDIHW